MSANINRKARTGTASQWQSANPTLVAGEIGFISDQNTMIVGDGSTAYTTLPPVVASKDFLIVATESARETLATKYKVNGLSVFVTDTKILYTLASDLSTWSVTKKAPLSAVGTLTVPGTVNLYVTTTGSATNPGTVGNPFRQPQNAVDEVVYSNVPIGTTVNIYCGAGTFNVPDTEQVPRHVFLNIYGSFDNIKRSGTATTSASLDGYAAIRYANVGTYTGGIGNGDHWYYNPTFNLGAISYTSVSPDGYYIYPGDIVSSDFEIYPIETIFEEDGYIKACEGKSREPYNFGTTQVSLPESNVNFFGIEFNLTGDETFTFRQITAYGCVLSKNGGSTSRVSVIGSTMNIKSGADTVVYAKDVSDMSGIIENTILLKDSKLSTAFFHQGTLRLYHGTNILGRSSTYGIDFRSDVTSAMVYYFGETRQFGNITVGTSMATSLLNYGSVTENGFFTYSIEAVATITGTVTGTGVNLIQGRGVGFETACDGNLTAGTPNVSIGSGVVTSTFAGLPISDVGQSVPYFTRVD